MLAIVPEQDGDGVLSLDKVGLKVNHVVVGIIGVRPTLELTFKDDQLTINPEPVLRVGGNFCYRLFGGSIKLDLLAVSTPLVGTIGMGCLLRGTPSSQIHGLFFRHGELFCHSV